MGTKFFSRLRARIERIWPGIPNNRHELGRAIVDASSDVARGTTAVVIGYLLTVRLLPPPVDLTGALTALLVLQASLGGSFKAGILRVSAVVTGILSALIVATFVGLNWWSLAIAVFVALMVARILRLGGDSNEAAISAMLILGSSGTDVAAFTRFATTMIGVAVGLGVALIWPRRIRVRDLTNSLKDAGDRLADIFDNAAKTLNCQTVTRDSANRGLEGVHRVEPMITAARRQLEEAEDIGKGSKHYRLFRANVIPLIRHGIDRLDRVSITAANLMTTISAQAPVEETPDDGYGDLVRPALAEMFSDLAQVIRCYQDLVCQDVLGEVGDGEARLREALEKAQDSLDRLTDVMGVGPDQRGLWKLRGSILDSFERMLFDLDIDEYTNERDEWRVSQLGLALPTGNSVGPKIRNPYSLYAQRRFHQRAQQSRQIHDSDQLYEIGDADTTTFLPISTENNS